MWSLPIENFLSQIKLELLRLSIEGKDDDGKNVEENILSHLAQFEVL